MIKTYWKGEFYRSDKASDFDNMIETWKRVKDTCGIED